MQKTISLSINTALFHIEEDAYKTLSNYLATIKKHFSSQEDAEEIVQDIENRIAEHLQNKLIKSKQVITLSDVEDLIAKLGTVEDFGDEEKIAATKTETNTSTQKPNKKLFRNPDDQIIGGVASGLGVYFGIDPVLFRLVFVLTTISGGFGILAYIILLIIMPEAKTPTEKMQMEGEPLNLESIDKKIKDLGKAVKEFPDTKVGQVAQKGVHFTRSIGERTVEILPSIGSGLVKLLGVIFVMAACIATLPLLTTLLMSLLNPNLAFGGVTLSELLGDYRFLSLSLHVSVIIPIITLGIGGAALLAKKNFLNWKFSLALFMLWVISLTSLTAASAAHLPKLNSWWEQQEIGQKYQIEKSITVGDFKKIIVSGNTRVFLTQGDTTDIKVKATPRVLDQLEITNSGETLNMHQNQNWALCLICWAQPATVYIITPSIEAVNLSGGVEFSGEGIIQESLNLDLSGATVVRLNGSIQKVKVEMSGASELDLQGKGVVITGKLSGASTLDASSFNVTQAYLEQSGASECRVDATEIVDVQLSGATELVYINYPNLKLNSEVTGAGELRSTEQSN